MKSASWQLALKPIILQYVNNTFIHVESTSCLLALKPSYYTIIVQYTIFTVRPENNRLLRYGTLARGNTHFPLINFPRTSGLARGKHPHSAHLCLTRSPHLRRPHGFGNRPISRPGVGKLPTRQSMSSLWSPGCLLPNSQLGWVSPYGDEVSPPLSGQIRYAACRNRLTNHFINNLDQQHYFPVLWINLLPFVITLWSHPTSTNYLISDSEYSPDD